MISCRTCAVEYAEPLPTVCPICQDERQYVPATGQAWVTLEELHAEGRTVTTKALGAGMWGLAAEGVGIGQQMIMVATPAGSLLWDPIGFLDDKAVGFVKQQGPVLAIASSHPHMFGAQVEWSRALGGVPVLVNANDAEWIGRPDKLIKLWSETYEVTDGLALHQIGGHFIGSAVAHWSAGADGDGVLLSGDTIMVNPDGQTTSFQRSYPNRIPLSAAVVERIAAKVKPLVFEQIWNNFGATISSGASEAVQKSAVRHAAWVRGEFDHLT